MSEIKKETLIKKESIQKSEQVQMKTKFSRWHVKDRKKCVKLSNK
jgi:hypothetical protein